ncbi:MAG: DUF4271 domain-containing protein [Bacteroidia bacterium]|nr:DUF4271 domain-containing protein [Bacteroidia bacterium]
MGADTLHTTARDTSSVRTDTTFTQMIEKVPQNLLDSLGKPNTMRKYFFLNEQISGIAVALKANEIGRDLPRLKAIQLRKTRTDGWKFWTILFAILFLALIRLINIKRFNEILVSGFDLHADYLNYSGKTSNYIWSNMGLFLNFIFSVSLFLVHLFEVNQQIETDNFYLMFWQIAILLMLIYVAKFFINLIIGNIFKMVSTSYVALFNAMVVNNLLGVVLAFLNLFFVFVSDPFTANIISVIILLTLVSSVIYREIKNLIMTQQKGQYQFIYIFLYLCSLEILPWLVVFKLFLISW